jgi:hypothetical protein
MEHVKIKIPVNTYVQETVPGITPHSDIGIITSQINISVSL